MLAPGQPRARRLDEMAVSQPKATTQLSTEFFADRVAMLAWLAKHHANSTGIWLRLARKGAAVRSVSYQEAVEAALCYGWIDGQKKSESKEFWLQKFTPRGKRSIWSAINKRKAEALMESGAMKAAGRAAIERAQSDGSWSAAYASQSNAENPADFQRELDRNPKAKAFFATLDASNRYAIRFRLHRATKPETRKKRVAEFVRMLSNGEKIHNR
jgi:uncharacterized protein YdeI (YjbR/CyaY-like superfamily)